MQACTVTFIYTQTLPQIIYEARRNTRTDSHVGCAGLPWRMLAIAYRTTLLPSTNTPHGRLWPSWRSCLWVKPTLMKSVHVCVHVHVYVCVSPVWLFVRPSVGHLSLCFLPLLPLACFSLSLTHTHAGNPTLCSWTPRQANFLIAGSKPGVPSCTHRTRRTRASGPTSSTRIASSSSHTSMLWLHGRSTAPRRETGPCWRFLLVLAKKSTQ